MPWWAAILLAAFIGVSAYNAGYKSGLSSAPAAVAFEVEKQRADVEMERLRVNAIERSAPDPAECLPILVGGSIDLEEFCSNMLAESQQLDGEVLDQLGRQQEQEFGR